MKGKNFKINKCSKKYIYVLITCSFFIAKSIVYSLDELSFDTNSNIFGIDLIIKKHILIRLLLEYLGYIILGGILIFRHRQKKEVKEDPYLKNLIQKRTTFVLAGANDSSIAKKILLISSLLYAIQLITRNFLYFFKTWKLDMWIFNILFINISMKYIMNTPLYKHQLFIFFFISITNLVLIIISSSINYKGDSFYANLINDYGNAGYIVLFYIIFLILSALISSSQVFQKKLMDVYYASYYKILFVIGIISFIFSLIALIITTNVNCGEYLNKRNICPLSHDDYQQNSKFIDNFFVYLYNMGDRHKSNKLSFYVEIFLVYLLLSFLNFMKYLYETLIILYLNPNYILLSDIIYYSLKKIIYLIYNPKDATTYLSLIGEFVALFGYLFYLEIFEINICGLNRDTKNRISYRGILEVIDNNKTFADEDDDEIELSKYNDNNDEN